jgi:general secretion pathway protein F
MPLFRYRTLQPSGAVVNGEIEARDRVDAASRLQAAGTYPIEVAAAEAPPRTPRGERTGTRLSARELALFARELATLVGAGLPLDRALGVVGALKGSSRAARVAAELRTALAAGDRFSSTCARHRAFPRLAAAMLAAGEARGDIGSALDRIAGLLERARAVTQSVVSALIYPISVTVVGLLSAVFLLTFVVPRFEALLHDLKKELPPATRLLMDLSTFVQDWGLLVGGVLAAGAVLFALRLRDPSFRLRVDGLLLRLPVIGGLVAKVEAERFARLLGGLVAAGVPLPGALATAGEAATNRAIAEAAAKAVAGIERGDGVAAALAAPGVFPELLVELARVGEETGRLADMLEKAAEVLKQEIEVTVTRLIGLLTPASTILLGVLIGGLILGVFNAVLEAYDIGI